MSKNIPVLGKIWLTFIGIMATIGVVSNFAATLNGIVYLISAIACLAELIGIIFMLKGEGLPYLGVYAAAYILNAVLVFITTNNSTDLYWSIGFILGIVLIPILFVIIMVVGVGTAIYDSASDSYYDYDYDSGYSSYSYNRYDKKDIFDDLENEWKL